MKKRIAFFRAALFIGTYALIGASCNLDAVDVPMNCTRETPAPVAQRAWTVIVYMAADNDLESEAMRDLNELEAGFPEYPGTRPITVLALVDRARGGDSSNGDWTGTRLYEISHDDSESGVVIGSKEIACPPLGLSPGIDSELDLGSSAVLENLVTFAKAQYAADRYALVIWGHGTGWKGVAVDATAGSFMRTDALASALEGKGISIIGFDACFGSTIESAWTLRGAARYLVGSSGIEGAGGWNYKAVLGVWNAGDGSEESLCSGVLDRYAAEYGGIEGNTMSVIDLSKIDAFRRSFEDFALAGAAGVTSMAKQNALRALVFGSCEIRHDSAYPCDAFIDIASLSEALRANALAPSAKTAVLDAALNEAVPLCWSAGEGNSYGTNRKKISALLIPFIARDTPSPSHDPEYVRGSGASSMGEFERSSTGWVPNQTPEKSFLDALFYRTF